MNPIIKFSGTISLIQLEMFSLNEKIISCIYGQPLLTVYFLYSRDSDFRSNLSMDEFYEKMIFSIHSAQLGSVSKMIMKLIT
jgi:hypothetical protein